MWHWLANIEMFVAPLTLSFRKRFDEVNQPTAASCAIYSLKPVDSIYSSWFETKRSAQRPSTEGRDNHQAADEGARRKTS